VRDPAARRMRAWILVLLLSAFVAALGATCADAAVVSGTPAGVPRAAEQQSGGSSLEAAAAKAGNTGRAVAMSLIGLAFAVAGTVLAFRRDFKEAAAVFAVGIISVLLATQAGVSLLRDTVTSLFGSH
jgi:glucose uptake protein GlcU